MIFRKNISIPRNDYWLYIHIKISYCKQQKYAGTNDFLMILRSDFDPKWPLMSMVKVWPSKADLRKFSKRREFSISHWNKYYNKKRAGSAILFSSLPPPYAPGKLCWRKGKGIRCLWMRAKILSSPSAWS